MTYFDHAASSVIYQEVLEQLSKTLKEDFANPSARHLLGHDIAEKTEVIRLQFLKTLGAQKNDTLIFTSSATESNNTVIRGLEFNSGDVIYYCKADHPSLTVPAEMMAEKYKAELRQIVLLEDGTIDLKHFENSLDEKVKLVILTHVNNQSGVVNPVELLAKIVKAKSKAHVHIDAVQSYGKIDFKLSADMDSVSFTSHKIGGPKGVAALFLKREHNVLPLLLGGGQESGMRSGTLAWPLVSAFHEAMNISMKKKESAFSEISGFSEKIRAELGMNIKTATFPFNSTSPYIVSLIIPGISSDVILRHLETKNVFISSTSACTSKRPGFNSSLNAMNIPEHLHKNFLRISLSPSTTADDVETLIREFKSVWEDIKHMSANGRGR